MRKSASRNGLCANGQLFWSTFIFREVIHKFHIFHTLPLWCVQWIQMQEINRIRRFYLFFVRVGKRYHMLHFANCGRKSALYELLFEFYFDCRIFQYSSTWHRASCSKEYNYPTKCNWINFVRGEPSFFEICVYMCLCCCRFHSSKSVKFLVYSIQNPFGMVCKRTRSN